MMKNQIIIIVSLIIVGFISCKKDSPSLDSPEKPIPPTERKEETIPEWNKSNTGVVYFISDLQDTSFSDAKETYKQIGSFLRDKEYAIAVIDRSDMDRNTNFNGGVTATYYANRKNAFAYNRYNSQILEGSTLLVNKIDNQYLLKIDEETYLTYFPTSLVPEIVFPFTTLRIENEKQIGGISSQLNYWRQQKFVCIGTVKNEVLQHLKREVESKSSLKLTKVVSSRKTPYSIFMIAPKSWVLREKEIINKNEKSIYKLKIEANVIY